MSLFPHCRIIVDPQPNSGDWNMAVDETLLESAILRNACTLRFYQWKEATVSLGYFQKNDEIEMTSSLVGLPVVRRLSGGGAILHHHELTYSCAVPSHQELAVAPHRLYRLIHEQIIDALAQFKIEAAMRGIENSIISDKSQEEPFLCFGRGDQHDIVFKGHKILGSAQRRRRGCILQHGSLLMEQSKFAKQFPGLLNLVPKEFSRNKILDLLILKISRILGQAIETEQLLKFEEDRARTLQHSR